MSHDISIGLNDTKRRLLVNEAKRWVSFTESGGDNKGQIVEAFQRVVDGTAQGEPWCLCFVQYCLRQVDSAAEEVFREKLPLHNVEKTEHCLTCWHKSPAVNKRKTPKEGSVVIWRHGTTTSGHTGIVVQIEKDGDYMWVVEGNTGTSNSAVQRDGDGIYLKRRKLKGNGSMRVLGFLEPWV